MVGGLYGHILNINLFISSFDAAFSNYLGSLLHVTDFLKFRREDFEGRTNKPLKDMGTEEVYLNTLLLVLCASVRWKRVVSLQVCDQGKCKHSTV